MIPRDAIFKIERGGTLHIVSEHYGYKTEPYYTILDYESRGVSVLPTSKDVIDASVVPICLERARLNGIPVCKWGISQGYVPTPSILYGMNYFSCNSNYSIIEDGNSAKKVIDHITNNGKYPFCYQELNKGYSVESVVSIFGNVIDKEKNVADVAKKIYDIFSIPLVTLILVRYEDRYFLSSLTMVKYSKLSKKERALLYSYLEEE
jgi:hypothetical protein